MLDTSYKPILKLYMLMLAGLRVFNYEVDILTLDDDF